MTFRVSKVAGIGLCAAALALSSAGCGGSDNKTGSGTHDIWFNGAVINGVTSVPVKTYDISLVWGPKSIKGKVDAATGRFTLGPLPAWNDYGVVIDAGTDYRAFSSFNSGISPPAPPTTSQSADIYSANTTQTFNFDAYLFPSVVATPDVSISILETGQSATPPTGSIRLQPTTLPVIQAQASEVANQVWGNDNDLFAGVVNDSFADGLYKATGDKLLYGVNYQVTVFGVDKFQPGGGTIQAGVTSQASISLSPQTKTPIAIQQNDSANCIVPLPTSNADGAKVTVTFNQPVQFVGTTYAETFDNAFTEYSTSSTGIVCPLKTNLDATVQEHGTKIAIGGTGMNVLTASWNPAMGFATDIGGTACTPPQMVSYLTYSFSGLSIMPVGGDPTTDARSLATLGLSSVLCQMH